jgi:hypothetical protein
LHLYPIRSNSVVKKIEDWRIKDGMKKERHIAKIKMRVSMSLRICDSHFLGVTLRNSNLWFPISFLKGTTLRILILISNSSFWGVYLSAILLLFSKGCAFEKQFAINTPFSWCELLRIR